MLILREVLRWHADEVAELLETSVASVNSALQRARATLDTVGVAETDTYAELGRGRSSELLDRYVDAFERYDIDALIELIHEDATMSMPPFDHLAARHGRHRRVVRRARRRVRRVASHPRPWPTARRRTRSTAPTRPAGTTPWALGVLEIPTAGSSGSTRSSTSSGCSRCSTCRCTSVRTTDHAPPAGGYRLRPVIDAAVPGFLPSTHGLRFKNDWPKAAALRIDVLGQQIPVGERRRGLCGGMVFAVRDLFRLGRPVPPDTTAPGSGPLYEYIGERLQATASSSRTARCATSI